MGVAPACLAEATARSTRWLVGPSCGLLARERPEGALEPVADAQARSRVTATGGHPASHDWRRARRPWVLCSDISVGNSLGGGLGRPQRPIAETGLGPGGSLSRASTGALQGAMGLDGDPTGLLGMDKRWVDCPRWDV